MHLGITPKEINIETMKKNLLLPIMSLMVTLNLCLIDFAPSGKSLSMYQLFKSANAELPESDEDEEIGEAKYDDEVWDETGDTKTEYSIIEGTIKWVEYDITCHKIAYEETNCSEGTTWIPTESTL